MAKINVKETEITIISIKEKDYISLTDMVRNIENGLALIEKWLRNKNTIEFIGIWEEMYNPHFNSPEFEGIKNSAGLNRFILSVKQWIEKTNSIGIIAKAGRDGETYAHKDTIHTEHCLNFDFQMICLIIMIILHTNQFNPINHASDSNMENLNAVFINENLLQKEG
jgi:hypothetical protein